MHALTQQHYLFAHTRELASRGGLNCEFGAGCGPARGRGAVARAARAGVDVQLLDDAEEAALYDLVLCDAPCSGSGTWRRSPDEKWRLSAERLGELTRIQGDILDRAQALVAPQGQLAYATCSLFHAENEAQSDHFMARHPGWRETLRRRWPIGDEGDGFYPPIHDAEFRGVMRQWILGRMVKVLTKLQ